MQLVLRQAACPWRFGDAGLALAFLTLRCWARSLLYQTSAVDPLAIGGSLLLLLAAAALDPLPARRAASVDPMQVLRNE